MILQEAHVSLLGTHGNCQTATPVEPGAPRERPFEIPGRHPSNQTDLAEDKRLDDAIQMEGQPCLAKFHVAPRP